MLIAGAGILAFVGLGLATGTWSWGFLTGWLGGSLGIWWLRMSSQDNRGRGSGTRKKGGRR
ncbi:MAG: hypothetical protein C4575_04830 [Desulforudis sp.]|nr:hypothetical protein [Clostridia bacterium]RJX21010.1 MAG: hypothetical protein C4575_04830 [Desulforudis sp.]